MKPICLRWGAFSKLVEFTPLRMVPRPLLYRTTTRLSWSSTQILRPSAKSYCPTLQLSNSSGRRMMPWSASRLRIWCPCRFYWSTLLSLRGLTTLGSHSSLTTRQLCLLRRRTDMWFPLSFILSSTIQSSTSTPSLLWWRPWLKWLLLRINKPTPSTNFYSYSLITRLRD